METGSVFRLAEAISPWAPREWMRRADRDNDREVETALEKQEHLASFFVTIPLISAASRVSTAATDGLESDSAIAVL